MYKADLHTHSTCSDGTVTPLDLLCMAKEAGLSGLSITDHDTILAYTEEVFKKAKELSLLLVAGVEFSCHHRNTPVHVLGYNIDLENEVLKSLCQRHQKRRQDRNKEVLQLLKKHNMIITEEDLIAKGSVGRPHIALAMMKKGYVSSVKDAFHTFLAEGRPCYAPGKKFPIEDAIDVIHEAKGCAILAHPHLIQNKQVTREVIEMNFDGIEGYYAKLSPQEEKPWILIGEKKNWIITGGSDFHGEVKKQIPLGASWTNFETICKILKNS